MVDALAPSAEEGRSKVAISYGELLQALTRRSPNEETHFR